MLFVTNIQVLKTYEICYFDFVIPKGPTESADP